MLTKMSLYDVIGIGGIKELNILDVMATSVKGVAVIGAIHEAVDTAFTVKKLRKLIDPK